MNKVEPRDRVKYILTESDPSLAVFLLGIGLMLWGGFAVVMRPSDFYTFSSAMELGGTWFWFLNYMGAGYGFIWLSVKGFPPTSTLIIGGYACLAWTWIAAIRGFSNVTSGVTLNALVIIVGAVMIQRSGKK